MTDGDRDLNQLSDAELVEQYPEASAAYDRIHGTESTIADYLEQKADVADALPHLADMANQAELLVSAIGMARVWGVRLQR